MAIRFSIMLFRLVADIINPDPELKVLSTGKRICRVLLFLTLAFASCYRSFGQDVNELRDLDSYPELGVAIGFPASLNAEAGYWFGPVGARLSGMYWGDSYGVQGNVGYKLSETRRRYHAVALVAGRGVGVAPDQECCDWTYVGGAYNLVYRGFFLEAGLETPVKVRRGNFRDVVPLFQIGYLHRFLHG